MSLQLPNGYNLDVQRFMDERRYIYREACSTSKTYTIIDTLEQIAIKAGKSFQKLFPPKTKRKKILNKIAFLVSGTGICKIAAKTLAEEFGCTERTVWGAVINLKEIGEILVSKLADADNKYIFVLKSHPNFQQILKQVFFIDDLPMEIEAPEKAPISVAISGLQNAESLDTVSVKGEKTSSNYINSFNSLSSKQERDIIRDSIENEFVKNVKTPEEEAEYNNTYYVSEKQHEFYAICKNQYNLDESITRCASILGLRFANVEQPHLLNAVKTVIKIDFFIKKSGEIREGVPALFTKMYKHGLDIGEYEKQYKAKRDSPVNKKPIKDVPFWNWLENF